VCEGEKKISDSGESARAGIYTRGDLVIYERRFLVLGLFSRVLSIRSIDSSPEQGRVLDRSRRD